MKKKTVSAIALTLLLTSLLMLAFNIQPVKAEGTIYIRADGSIDPSTAPISSLDNVTYVLTDNISASVVIQKDSIVVDGNGYSVLGPGGGIGIDLNSRNNVTVKHIRIESFPWGIYLTGSSNNTIIGNELVNNGHTSNPGGGIGLNQGNTGNLISENNMSSNSHAIYITSSHNNTVSGNDFENNGCGIRSSYYAKNNNMTSNSMFNNHWGIYLEDSPNSTISNNRVLNDGAPEEGILLVGSSHYNNITDNILINAGFFIASYGNTVSENFVNGKPLVYLENVSNDYVDNGGEVILVNCDNIRVQGLDISNTSWGVELYKTQNSIVSGNRIERISYWAIAIMESANINITGNFMADNMAGIWIGDSSNNTVCDNHVVRNSDRGISIHESVNTTVTENLVAESETGLWLGVSHGGNSRNYFYHNGFWLNSKQVHFEYWHPDSVNYWNNGYPSGGNYWSDYTGVDLLSGPYQNETGSDGIGDTPYIIDGNNQDNYPLVHPYGSICNLNTSLTYLTIQSAINAPETLNGHTIFVRSGTYYEHVVANKTVSLLGVKGTIIDASQEPVGIVNPSIAKWNGITILANYCTVAGFEIRNAANFGIEIRADYGAFQENLVENCNWAGIALYAEVHDGVTYHSSYDNLVLSNTVRYNHMGVWLDDAYDNTVSLNTIERNRWNGIYLSSGSRNNTITNNLVSYSSRTQYNEGGYGIAVGTGSHNNLITGNDISNNAAEGIRIEIFGLGFPRPYDNLIHHNNFVNNAIQAHDDGTDNIWDDGYPSGGNYWSDYVGVDVKRGSGQDLPGSDGIGDAPYIIDANNRDRYPLMNPYGAPSPQTYNLTITSTVGGTTDPAPGPYSYTADSTVQVTAVPEANYLFNYWELDSVNVGSANPYSVTMDKDHTLKAVFSPIPPPLSASISPLSASILVGQSVTFTSTVSGGYTSYGYQWYLNGNPVSGANATSWTFTPTTSGIYYVHLKVTDAKSNTAQSDTARITVATVPVGGYSIPMQVQTKAEPVLPYIALIAALTAIFTKLRPKTKRRR
jgi:parallel beta-helix repeat protein